MEGFMDRRTRWTIAVLALGAACVAGLYLSGYLVRWLLKLDGLPVQWQTWWTYYRALELPQVAPYAGKIRLAGGLGFGLPLLAWLLLLVPLLRTSERALHGRARFAGRADLRKHGLLQSSVQGIVVGKLGNDLLRLSGQQFVILAAPTRSGKGVGVVVPNLLDYQESMVVLDIKQENFDLTSGWRKSQGQDIYLFNPFAEDRRTHRWNPLSYVSPDPNFRISDIQAISAMLYPEGSDDQKFWVSQARNAFMAFALYLFENFDDAYRRKLPAEACPFPTVGRVFRLATSDGQELKSYLKGLAERPFLSTHAKTAFANLLSQADETFASIMGMFKEPLNAWLNPVLDAATSENDFLLTDVRKKRMTIYIGIQPNKLAEAKLIVNLFFSQLINQNTRELPQNNKALKHQCLLLMDEFTSIGKVEIIASAVSYMAGYNIRLLPIIQSMAQLDATYGKEISRTLITNHALQIIYAPREQKDANDYSEMLGYNTVRQESVTRGRDVSRSQSQERRALMLPQELKALGQDKEVFLYEGIAHPVQCQKIRYYQDPYFTSRLLPKVEIPQLDWNDAPMPSITLKTVGAVALAGLAMSAAASPLPVDKTPPAPAASAALVEQARQDGLTIEQERYIQSQPKDPKHHWEGYSDKPVAAKLGPNTFMFPMNLYDDQIGPDFQGSVAFMLHWPDLKPFPPGAQQNPKYSEAYTSEGIMVGLSYIDRRPIDTLLLDTINEGPGHFGWIDSDDPREHRSLRIKGSSVYGLTPYYTDTAKLTAYFQKKGIASGADNVSRNADDWFLDYDDRGVLRNVVICTSREIRGANLIQGKLEQTPPGDPRGGCTQTFIVPKYGLSVRVSYLRAYLAEWQSIEKTIRGLFDKYHQ
jgi:type IV secretion system protein VirD4